MSRENLTRSDVLVLLSEWQTRHAALDDVFETLKASVGREPESPLWNAAWGVFEAYTEQLSHRLGDNEKDSVGNNWLTWYAFENDFGAKAMKAKAAHMKCGKPIRTVADLATLLGFTEPGKSTR